jgi:hypothetical protein
LSGSAPPFHPSDDGAKERARRNLVRQLHGRPRRRYSAGFASAPTGTVSGRNRPRGSKWQTQFPQEVTCQPAPINARTVAVRFRWGRRRISRLAHNAATVTGRRSAEATALKTLILTAIPRDAPSVDCLGMARAQGLVHLAASASGRNATLKPSTWWLMSFDGNLDINHPTRFVV